MKKKKILELLIQHNLIGDFLKKSFVQTIFNPGTICTLYGLPGSGKTNLVVYMIEKAVDYGMDVWTIVHFFPKDRVGEACSAGLLPVGIQYKKVPPEVHTVKRISDLLLGVIEHNSNAVVLDEAGLFASSRAPMARKLKDILNLTYIIRHFRSSFMFITQTSGSIPPDLRENLVSFELNIIKGRGSYRKLVIKTRQLYYDDDGEEHINFRPVKTVGRIPLTRYPWDGHYIPKFDFDISLDEAWSRLGEFNSLEVREVGADIIRELVEEKKSEKDEQRQSPTELREEVRNLFLTLEDSGNYKKRADIINLIAEQYDKSWSWVDQKCRGLDFDKNKYNPAVDDN